MNSRERFVRAVRSESVDRPPIWVMRQAGRHLPEYRELRQGRSFHELVKTPDLACEVTMQPVRRYGMDAAIIFSDILVIPEALGQPYSFRDTGGIQMSHEVSTVEDVQALDPSAVEERLSYVGDALRLVRQELGEERALIGFAGAPWTIATYMIEGGSSKEYRAARSMYLTNRALFDSLMQKITDATIAYIRTQIDAGVDAVQLFDSWGGVLAPHHFRDASSKWMQRIVAAFDSVPFIVFSKGAHHHVDALRETGADCYGITWTTDLREAKRALGDDCAVQGNLDPVILETTPELTRSETRRILDSMKGVDGHVFNLGHGISPHGRIDCMEAMVDEVRSA